MTLAEAERAAKMFSASPEASEEKLEAPPAEVEKPAATEAPASSAEEFKALQARLDTLEKENQRLRSIEGSQRQRGNVQSELSRLREKVNLLLERDEEVDPALKKKLDDLSAEESAAAQQERLAVSVQRASQRHAQSLNRLLQRHDLKQADVLGLNEIAVQWGQALSDPLEDTREALDGFYSEARDLIEDHVSDSRKKATAAVAKEAEDAARGKARKSGLNLSEVPPAGGAKGGQELIKAYADYDSDDTEGVLELVKKMGVRIG